MEYHKEEHSDAVGVLSSLEMGMGICVLAELATLCMSGILCSSLFPWELSHFNMFLNPFSASHDNCRSRIHYNITKTLEIQRCKYTSIFEKYAAPGSQLLFPFDALW